MIRLAISALLLGGVAMPAVAQSEENKPTIEFVNFDKPNANATAVARKMYGREYRLVLADRVWLEEPTEGDDQMVIQIGNGRSCDEGCDVAALYHDGSQWLEVWRAPGTNVGIGPLSVTGMKSLFDGTRFWAWSGSFYTAQIVSQTQTHRAPTETELKAVTQALQAKFLGGSAPLSLDEVEATDVDLRDGNEVAVKVMALYYCGNSACPVVFLDGEKKPIDTLSAWGPDFSVIEDKDASGRRLVEVTTQDGVATFSLGQAEPVSVIPAMPITVAGQKR